MKTSAGLFLTDILPHKRGLFTKIVKNKVFGKHPPHHVFSMLKQSGVDGVEIFLPSFTKVTHELIDELKETLHKEQVTVLSLHQSLRFFSKTRIKEIEKLFEYANELANKQGYKLNPMMSGHRLGDFPHKLFSSEKLFEIS